MEFDAKEFLTEISQEYRLIDWFTDDGLGLLDAALDLYDGLDIAEVDIPLTAIEMLRRE